MLHVVESLDSGAVENWLIRMLTHADDQGRAPNWTFYCALGRPGRLEKKAKALGADIIHSPVPISEKIGFARALRAETVGRNVDVLHCHHDLVSGLYLAAVAGLPLRARLVHIHNADEEVLTPNRWKQALYRPALRRICLALADRIVGISDHTLDTFLAGRPRRRRRDIVHRYGIDPVPFDGQTPDRLSFRRALGLEADAAILLFGGRLVPEKNPLKAVEVLAALRREMLNAVAVFAGAGALEEQIVAHARALGVENWIRMLGWRNDLASIMRCSDWFILPRPAGPMEGFGLAVIEAQLAGLRLLVSDRLPDDPFLPTACFRRLPVNESADRWATAAIDLMREPLASPLAVRQALSHSAMDMDHALDELLALHG